MSPFILEQTATIIECADINKALMSFRFLSVSSGLFHFMRLSLNFKGPEYAFARKFLLRNLSGNSGWRTEEAKARHDAHKIRTEIEAPEVTINQASIEGGEADAGISE